MTEHAPEIVQSLLLQVSKLFQDGVLSPPTITTYPIEKAKDVFRLVQNNQHVGKLVLEIAPNFYPSECKPPAVRITIRF